MEQKNITVFLTNEAVELGIEESIVFSYLRDLFSSIDSESEVDYRVESGLVWVKLNCKEINRVYPYISESRARLALNRLVNRGLISRAQLTKNEGDSSYWYVWEQGGELDV